MLKRGANPNHKDKAKKTAIHYASRAGNLELCRLLIQQGSDPKMVDCAGKNAIETARDEGKMDVV